MSNRKRNGGDAYFKIIVYTEVTAVRSEDDGSGFYYFKDGEQALVDSIFFRMPDDGSPDTIYWRSSSFGDICNGELVESSSRT